MGRPDASGPSPRPSRPVEVAGPDARPQRQDPLAQHDPRRPGIDRAAQEAEAAVLAVVRESKSTGHASIRPVIAAKQKLSTYERKILPGIKGRSVTEGDDLERFFVELDRSLDAMNSIYN